MYLLPNPLRVLVIPLGEITTRMPPPQSRLHMHPWSKEEWETHPSLSPPSRVVQITVVNPGPAIRPDGLCDLSVSPCAEVRTNNTGAENDTLA